MTAARGYQLRRDPIRCEGTYRAPTSGGIEIISFARRLPRSASETARRIEIDVPGQPDNSGKIVIRVWALMEDV
jgi:hypothetical protein